MTPETPKDRKVYIDGGFHLGEGLEEFTTILGLDDSWEIYAFEPNPACDIHEKVKRFPFPVVSYQAALWISDTPVTLRQQHQKTAASPTKYSTDPMDGWGSHLAETDANHKWENEVFAVGVDLAEFVFDFPVGSVSCKLDIEGAEFAVLRHLLKTKTIDRFKELWVEFHPMNVPNESGETVEELKKELRQHTIIHDWK